MSQCQICAVSVFASRTRTAHDPSSNTLWTNKPDDRAGYHSTSSCSLLPEQSGCQDTEGVRRRDLKYNRHIPGPGCTYTLAYNGSKISHQEMQGSEDIAYIIKKPTSDYGRNGYEKKSNWCLPFDVLYLEDGWGLLYANGNEDHCFLPQNGGNDHHIPLSEADEEIPLGIPVHDWCWKIFENVCRNALGDVDLQGFVALFFRNGCKKCGFQEMNHHPAVRRNWISKGYNLGWAHTPGTEFLVANPQDIPGYLVAIQPGYSKLSATELPSRLELLHLKNPDLFLLLPAEIRNQIARDLSITDILNLRTVSRAFSPPNPDLYLHLIERDFPWFHEFDDLKQLDNLYYKKLDDIQKAKNTQSVPLFFPIRPDPTETEEEPEGPPAREPDWVKFYKQLYFAKRDILGVKNRVRIWEAAEEIVARISRLRETVPEELDVDSGLMLLPAKPSPAENDQRGKKAPQHCLRCKKIK